MKPYKTHLSGWLGSVEFVAPETYAQFDNFPNLIKLKTYIYSQFEQFEYFLDPNPAIFSLFVVKRRGLDQIMHCQEGGGAVLLKIKV